MGVHSAPLELQSSHWYAYATDSLLQAPFDTAITLPTTGEPDSFGVSVFLGAVVEHPVLHSFDAGACVTFSNRPVLASPDILP
jgi:hypothetical protein